MHSHDTSEGPGQTLDSLARRIADLVSTPAPMSPARRPGSADALKPWFAFVRDRAKQQETV